MCKRKRRQKNRAARNTACAVSCSQPPSLVSIKRHGLAGWAVQGLSAPRVGKCCDRGAGAGADGVLVTHLIGGMKHIMGYAENMLIQCQLQQSICL